MIAEERFNVVENTMQAAEVVSNWVGSFFEGGEREGVTTVDHIRGVTTVEHIR